MSHSGGKQGATFTNRLGFILASVGSAVGMGNIWMFPYRVSQYGGAAFLIVYFGFIFLFGWVGLSGEFALGRLTGTGPIGSYDYAMKSRGLRGGKVLGAIPMIGSLGIAVGYAVIVGWVLRYFAGSLTGSALSSQPEGYFDAITGSLGSWPWHVIVVAATGLILAAGVLKGIEKVSRVMMPTFFILFIGVAVWVFFLDGALAGYEYLLVPDWGQLLNPTTWVMAMGQAFFSLSITGSGMIIYGSYLSRKEDISASAMSTAVLDTCAALLAAFAIVPAVFAFGLPTNSGPSLLFITLPRVFAQMPGGQVVAVVFFLSIIFAGITSLVNMMEVCSEAVMRQFGWKRVPSVALVAAVVLAAGLFIEHKDRLDAWMNVISIYVVPCGALLGAVMIYWVLGPKKIDQELNLGRRRPVSRVTDFVARYVYVLLTAVVLVLSVVYQGIG